MPAILLQCRVVQWWNFGRRIGCQLSDLLGDVTSVLWRRVFERGAIPGYGYRNVLEFQGKVCEFHAHRVRVWLKFNYAAVLSLGLHGVGRAQVRQLIRAPMLRFERRTEKVTERRRLPPQFSAGC